MQAFLVVNYAEMKNKYLKLSSDSTVMYINTTDEDGNITYVSEEGDKSYYSLTNVFFRAPAETTLNGKSYSLEL
jgi:carbonic anhydrase